MSSEETEMMRQLIDTFANVEAMIVLGGYLFSVFVAFMAGLGAGMFAGKRHDQQIAHNVLKEMARQRRGEE